MTQVDDLSRSLIVFEQNSTMVVVLEMSQSSWLAAGVVPGIERRPLKKLDPDPTALLRLVEGWRDHAMKVGRMITRIVLAFEAGRDGFWLARWLRDLIRVFLGWLRGEPRHCKMVAIPTLEEEDARRPSRERESLVGERTRIINRMKAVLIRLGIRGLTPLTNPVLHLENHSKARRLTTILDPAHSCREGRRIASLRLNRSGPAIFMYCPLATDHVCPYRCRLKRFEKARPLQEQTQSLETYYKNKCWLTNAGNLTERRKGQNV